MLASLLLLTSCSQVNWRADTNENELRLYPLDVKKAEFDSNSPEEESVEEQVKSEGGA